MTKEEYQEYKKCLSDYNYWKEHYVIFPANDDLEEEIDKYFDGWFNDAEYGQAVMDESRGFLCAGVVDCKDIARHFYELGQQSRPKLSDNSLEEEIAGMYQALFGTDIINRKEMLYLETFNAIARHFAEWGAKSIKSMIQERYDENCRCAEKIKSFGIRACEDNDILSLIENRYE